MSIWRFTNFQFWDTNLYLYSVRTPLNHNSCKCSYFRRRSFFRATWSKSPGDNRVWGKQWRLIVLVLKTEDRTILNREKCQEKDGNFFPWFWSEHKIRLHLTLTFILCSFTSFLLYIFTTFFRFKYSENNEMQCVETIIVVDA